MLITGKVIKNRFILLLAIFISAILLTTLLPQPSLAAGEEVDKVIAKVALFDGNNDKIIPTEYLVNNNGFKIKITLDENVKWASDLVIENVINRDKIELLLNNITAKKPPEQWNKVIDKIKKGSDIIEINNDNDTLTITVPAMNDDKGNPQYIIDSNELITVKIPPVLLENWTQPVTVEGSPFIIYANPRAFIEGNITTATSADIRRGGKTIQIRLLNATWNWVEIEKISGLNHLLEQFKIIISENEKKEWEVVNAIKKQPDLSLRNNDTTLEIKLPPVPEYAITSPQTVTFNVYNASNDNTLININENISDVIKFPISTTLPTFTITPSLSLAQIKTESSSNTDAPLTERDINNGAGDGDAGSITITLEENEWATDLADTINSEENTNVNKYKQKALIDAFTAGTEPEQWEKVKDALKKAVGSPGNNFEFIQDSDSNPKNRQLKITLPKVEDDYFITKDQTITLKIPTQMLAENAQIEPLNFTIKANPKAILSGGEFTEADIVTGNKKIVITLVNSTWKPQVATNAEIRNDLIDLLTANANVSDPAVSDDPVQWNTTALSAIKAAGNVTIAGDQVLTITLPPVPGFDIEDNIKINLSDTLKKDFLTDTSDNDIPTYGKIIIKPSTDQSAVISGSILSNTTDYDIANGGKTSIITLRNDTWKEDIDFKNKLLTGFNATDGGNADKGAWNEFINNNVEVTKTSDREIVIKLTPSETFKLTDDIIVQPTIDHNLLSTANENITASPAFKIAAVKVELSGTALQSLDETDIQKGGKTIIITLKNASWSDVEDFNDQLINAFKSTLENKPWSKVIEALQTNPDSIKRSKNQVTIKLPPVPDYKLQSNEVETVTLTIPSALIKDAPENSSLKATEKLTIGQVASATISPSSLDEADIINGSATITIALTDAQWVENLPANTRAKNALIKGFTVQDQQNEWKLVSTALSKAEVELDNDNELTITLPAVPNYAVIRDQEVQITIPKTALANGKNDIEVSNKLLIQVPKVDTTESLAEILTAEGGLVGYLEGKNLEDIRVIVPPKIVQTINVNTIGLPGQGGKNDTLTTIEVLTNPAADAEVERAQITVPKGNTEEIQSLEGKNRFIFVFQNLEPNSEMKIAVYGNGDEPLQSEIYKKVTKGNKTYNELPKKDLNGSYSLYRLLTDKSLFKDILKYYPVNDLKIGETN